jgi:hypothetical protein
MAPKSMRTYRDFKAATSKKKSAYKLVRWLLATGRFPEFRLAERYRAEAAQGAEALAAEAVRRANALIVKYHQARRLSSSRAVSRSPRPPGATVVSFYSPHVGFYPAL